MRDPLSTTRDRVAFIVFATAADALKPTSVAKLVRAWSDAPDEQKARWYEAADAIFAACAEPVRPAPSEGTESEVENG